MGSRWRALSAAELSDDPVEQFRRWFAEAQADTGVVLAEAACLSTLGPNRTPEGRMVLVRHFDARGFVFYTNLKSNKARALDRHARAGLTFHWQPPSGQGRQVRVRGPVSPVSAEEADAYYAGRPLGSRIGAWASRQSRPIGSRRALEAAVAAREQEFGDGPVPRPPHWSGFRVRPEAMEFWQEGPHRLHDRFAYERRPEGGPGWVRRRLSP